MHCSHQKMEAQRSLDVEKAVRLDGSQLQIYISVSWPELEMVRVRNGQTRMVPRLREAHCLRDSWTKLNLLPAKIMQVSYCLLYARIITY